MTTLPNPALLSSTTRFRPKHSRAHSRSPSRSPERKAQFTTQHLDPLLRNLSPDSTLKALQATETIPLGPEQDALTRSITDATPSEREIGIRAAFAAQKLREWRTEISQWAWPVGKERAYGSGFLPPQDAATTIDVNGQRRIYLGYLPLTVVDQYEQRIDEIRDALETLGLEDIKDHVLQAHNSAGQALTTVDVAEKRNGSGKSYGRMRDFTALITATVIQALPDLAMVTMLIDTWNVRLTVLRDLPMLQSIMQAAKNGVHTASITIRDPKHAPLITMEDFETTKRMLGDKVADLGRRVDRMLDLLEGQEDALPQGWIDSLETIELDYATWVVEAQRVTTANESAQRPAQLEEPPRVELAQLEEVSDSTPVKPSAHQLEAAERSVPALAGLVVDNKETSSSPGTSKPALMLVTPTQHGHRREISEVSIADSAYSAFSGFSEAEIVDATPTPVLPGPKANLVDSPSPSDMPKPPMLQRASTASIEVVSKDQLKRVDLRRSMSADLVAKMAQSSDSSPSKALEQSAGRPRTGTTPMAELEDPTSTLMQHPPGSSYGLLSPVVAVAPPRTRSRSIDDMNRNIPALPRRSSKRKSMGPDSLMSGESSQSDLVSPIDPQITSLSSGPNDLISPIEPRTSKPPEFARKLDSTTAGRKPEMKDESLEAKIQDILLKLPTKIRLAKNSDETQSTEDSSASSTRASTPAPALTLSPVKASRRSSSSDTDVRVFHLTQQGQSRDAAPIKLFVRTVGENGERVMVRVGGGWADLAEYLKEYSLHHGRRSVSEGQLEVAQYPAGGKTQQRKESTSVAVPRRKTGHARGRSRSPSPPRKTDADGEKVWAPPPVPPIPASYTVQTPVVTSISRPNGTTETRIEGPNPSVPTAGAGSYFPPQTQPTVKSHTTTTAGVTTTTTVSIPSPQSQSTSSKANRYTPLGAAGPKATARRSVTFNGMPTSIPSTSRAGTDAWVDNVVGKARAVSNEASVNVVQGPTTTTTTRVVGAAPAPNSSSVPASRHGSGMLLPSAAQNQIQNQTLTQTSRQSSTTQKIPTSVGTTRDGSKDTPGPKVEKRRSILGLGDVGGIKRVFLRRKSSLNQQKK